MPFDVRRPGDKRDIVEVDYLGRCQQLELGLGTWVKGPEAEVQIWARDRFPLSKAQCVFHGQASTYPSVLWD